MTSGEDHFSVLADVYVGHRPRYPNSWLQQLAALCPRRGRALDCACGSGQATTALALYYDQVIACDASFAMLSRMHAPRNVWPVTAIAESLPFETTSVDLITVAQALHWFDANRFFAEARRLLRPGGVLATWCYQLLRIAPAIDDVLADLYNEMLSGYWPPERRRVDRGYSDVYMPLIEVATQAPDLTVHWSFNELLGYLKSWSATKHYEREQGHCAVDSIRPLLHGAWGTAESRTVRWPMAARVGRLE